MMVCRCAAWRSSYYLQPCSFLLIVVWMVYLYFPACALGWSGLKFGETRCYIFLCECYPHWCKEVAGGLGLWSAGTQRIMSLLRGCSRIYWYYIEEKFKFVEAIHLFTMPRARMRSLRVKASSVSPPAEAAERFSAGSQIFSIYYLAMTK
jgi:hypothetical protein